MNDATSGPQFADDPVPSSAPDPEGRTRIRAWWRRARRRRSPLPVFATMTSTGLFRSTDYAQVMAVAAAVAHNRLGAVDLRLCAMTDNGFHACPVEACGWHGVTLELSAHLAGHSTNDWHFTANHLREELDDVAQQLGEFENRFSKRLCEVGAKAVRALDRYPQEGSEYRIFRFELIGQLSAIRTALCLLERWDPDVDGGKEGRADDLITAWMEAHPEPEDEL